MRLVADLHIHSPYSRATGKNGSPPYLERWARIKGIDLLGTGDCTHPRWLTELRAQLEDVEPGFYTLKKSIREEFDVGPALAAELPKPDHPAPRFVLTGEISTIYQARGGTRKIHHLVILPDFKAAAAFQIALEKRGNISSDGRPILGIDSRDLLAILLDADDRALLIPAHIWTPWFSALGAKSGFDSIEACYGDLSARIPGVETGLSSNPPMNWALSVLDRFAIISNSDAHSPEKLGREATVFAMEPSYRGLSGALWSVRRQSGGDSALGEGGEILETIEFFPQEGKYHYDGHRKCGLYLSPEEAAAAEGRCRVCGKPLTRGVMGRVQELADRPVDEAGPCPREYAGTNRRPYRSLIPLKEILGEILGTGPASKRVTAAYGALIERTGSEFSILADRDLGDIEKIRCPGISGELLAAAVGGMRRGEVWVSPGYDGEYGVIRVFAPGAGADRGRDLFGSPDAAPGRSPKTGTPGQRPPSPAKPPVRPPEPPPGTAGERKPGFSPDKTQEAAIEYPGAHAIIIAGPGTGKTAVLAARVAHLIHAGRDPASILALSFTVKAAAELRERIALAAGSPATGPKAAGVTTATFHSLCCAILREQPPERGIPRNFRILDEPGRDRLLGEIIEGGKIPGSRRRLRSPQGLGEYIETRKRFLLRPGENRPNLGLPGASGAPFLPWEEPGETLGIPEIDPEAELLYELYRDRLRREAALDFEDLLAGTARLLGGNPPVLEHYRSRYRHILVDEYQDVNFAQYVLIRLLSPPPPAAGETPPELWVIGDPNQAIYGFRGADKGFMDRFLRDYPGAARFRLTKSFRCAAPIIKAAGRLVDASPEGAAGEVSLSRAVYPTGKAEAEGIARHISRLLGGTSFFALDSGAATDYGTRELPRGSSRGNSGNFPADSASLGNYAILLRSAALAGPITKALGDHGIPFELIGEKPWWEEEPVKTLLTALRETRAAAEPSSAAEPKDPAAIGSLSPAEAVRAAWECLGGRPGRKGKARETQPPPERLQGLAALYGDLPSLLDALTLSGAQGEISGGQMPEYGREGVRVMTIHGSKGLEFDHVFIAALEEGLLPFTLYMDKNRLPEDQVEEERRLLYVAMTRARRGLYLSRAESRTFRGRGLSLGPSRFWETLEDLIPPEAKAHPYRRDPQLRLF